jgi:hypothetical protein
MQLVQRAMLPASRPQHLAEVFLGGLLLELKDNHETPVEVTYDFAEGVRDLLLNMVLREEAARVVREFMAFFATQLGIPMDAHELLDWPDLAREVVLSSVSSAQVASITSVLCRIGGCYGQTGNRLREAANDVSAFAMSSPGYAPDKVNGFLEALRTSLRQLHVSEVQGAVHFTAEEVLRQGHAAAPHFPVVDSGHDPVEVERYVTVATRHVWDLWLDRVLPAPCNGP